MAITVAGGDRLAAQVERQVSGYATRLLPPLQGGALAATRDIAPWVKYVCESVGYTEFDLDMDELQRLHAIWQARGDYYDDAIGDATTVREAIADALAAGFAEPTIRNGMITPYRDEPRFTPEGQFLFAPHGFSAQNTTDSGEIAKSVELYKPDDYDGVDIEYRSSESWEWEVVKCRLPGDQGIRVMKQRIQGVTGRTQAWRIGMRLRRKIKYQRTTYSWSTEKDLLALGYGSFVALTDDVPGYGQSALVDEVLISGGQMIVRSSEQLQLEDGAQHVAALRRPDGSLFGPVPAGILDDFNFVIPLPDFDPITLTGDSSMEPTIIQFGTMQSWAYLALIQEINPRGNDGASATAINYDSRIYEDDANFPPPEA